jgi:hypothetical protein
MRIGRVEQEAEPRPVLPKTGGKTNVFYHFLRSAYQKTAYSTMVITITVPPNHMTEGAGA